MVNSINTNVGAMIALQNLNSINADLATTQNRISTGLRVASAKDDGATYAIAQRERIQVQSLDAVKDSLSRTSSSIDVALSAGESISDLLSQLRQKALAASDTSLDTTARDAIRDSFVSIRNQITKTLSLANFNGVNLLDGSRASTSALADASGSNRLTVAAHNMSLGGSIITLSAAASFASATDASNLLSSLDASINNVSSALASLGTASNALATHMTFVGKLQDTLTGAIGNLVDADVARESVNLQSLQVKQQLAVQALSIANHSQDYLLQLFR